MGITTSENNKKTSETKIEITSEQMKEAKEKQRKADKETLKGYKLQIDQFRVELEKWETALKLDLPNREANANIETLKKEIDRFKMYCEAIEKRLK